MLSSFAKHSKACSAGMSTVSGKILSNSLRAFSASGEDWPAEGWLLLLLLLLVVAACFEEEDEEAPMSCLSFSPFEDAE